MPIPKSLEFDAIIFDCDGTLADTMPCHYQAWVKTLNRYGIGFDEDRFYSLGGWPTWKIVEMLANEAGVNVDHHAVAHEKEQEFHKFMESVQPIDVIVAVAAAYRGKKPMAVATGSPRWTAERTLKQIGVLEWFDTIVAAEDVKRHKPEPDVFLEAARRLNTKAERCIVFEDAVPGIEGAVKAGMAVIDVRKHFTPRRISV
jgi:beta-phosphoglucomutase family hydrolase